MHQFEQGTALDALFSTFSRLHNKMNEVFSEHSEPHVEKAGLTAPMAFFIIKFKHIRAAISNLCDYYITRNLKTAIIFL